MPHTRQTPAAGGAAGASEDVSFATTEHLHIAEAAPKKQAKSGGRAPRRKGDRLERALVRLLQDCGLGAERVPLSGSAGGSYCGDLTASVIGRNLVIEAKARANGFRELYAWLRADRKEPLVILPLRLAVEIAAAAERGNP
jgi:hypothetical protein